MNMKPLFLILISLALPTDGFAAPKRAAKPAVVSAACLSLASDYEGFSKQLAANGVADALDSSAIRSTMRASQNSATLEQARMTADLLVKNGCKAPTYVPSAKRYLLPALTCSSDLTSAAADRAMARLDHKPLPEAAGNPPSCDRSTWTPNLG